MKRLKEVPNLSKEMQKIYDKFWDVKGDFRALMPHIDGFLEKYPTYPEAWVLKARALMGIGRNNEALRCLKMASRIDKWRLLGLLDEAEIFLDKKKNQESIDKYVEAVKAYATELKNGIDSYLLCCNSEAREKVQELTWAALTEFFLNDLQNQPFEKLHGSISEIKESLQF